MSICDNQRQTAPILVTFKKLTMLFSSTTLACQTHNNATCLFVIIKGRRHLYSSHSKGWQGYFHQSLWPISCLSLGFLHGISFVMFWLVEVAQVIGSLCSHPQLCARCLVSWKKCSKMHKVRTEEREEKKLLWKKGVGCKYALKSTYVSTSTWLATHPTVETRFSTLQSRRLWNVTGLVSVEP